MKHWSHAHPESASLGQNAVLGFLTVTKNYYRNEPWEFLCEKILVWAKTIVKILSSLSLYHLPQEKFLAKFSTKENLVLPVTAHTLPVSPIKRDVHFLFPSSSCPAELFKYAAVGSLGTSEVNTWFLIFFSNLFSYSSFTYHCLYCLSFFLLVSHNNSFLEWLGT